ncbi:hypothetical protein HID58_094382, partial [Brassica napus]
SFGSIELKAWILWLSFLAFLRCTQQRNCLTDCARAVFAGIAAAKSEALKLELLLLPSPERSISNIAPISYCKSVIGELNAIKNTFNNDGSYGIHDYEKEVMQNLGLLEIISRHKQESCTEPAASTESDGANPLRWSKHELR